MSKAYLFNPFGQIFLHLESTMTDAGERSPRDGPHEQEVEWAEGFMAQLQRPDE